MIERVTIYNRFNMEMFARTEGLNFPYEDKNWSLVSIYTTPEDEFLTEKNIEALKALGMKEYVSVCFWDINDTNKAEIDKKHPEAIWFDEQMGKDIIGTITRAEGWDDAVLVAHCDAGVSRSGAVGTFAVEYLGLDYETFIKENPYTVPNPFVLRTLRKIYGYNNKSAFGEIES